jgi:hypothetical protein
MRPSTQPLITEQPTSPTPVTQPLITEPSTSPTVTQAVENPTSPSDQQIFDPADLGLQLIGYSEQPIVGEVPKETKLTQGWFSAYQF